jgi:hypothetical protein
LEKIEDVVKDDENAVDWSGKVIEFLSETYDSGYGLENYLIHKEDSTSSIGSGVLTTDNERNPSETVYESPFGWAEEAYENSSADWGETIYSFPLYDREGDIEYPIIAKQVEYTSNLVKVLTTNEAIEWRFGSNPAVSESARDYHVATKEDTSLQYFIDTFWGGYPEVLKRYREIEVRLNLNELDLKDLNLMKLVYLAQKGRYYFINEIKTSESGSVAKLVELPQIFEYSWLRK